MALCGQQRSSPLEILPLLWLKTQSREEGAKRREMQPAGTSEENKKS
jgi:hypothetical protein